MATDSAFWRDLGAQFRALHDPRRLPKLNGLKAMLSNGQWQVYGGPPNKSEREGLQFKFRSLARLAAVAAGLSSDAQAVDGWLNLLRRDTPHCFHAAHGTENGVRVTAEGGWIENPELASAEYCVERATRAFELETAAVDNGTPTQGPSRRHRPIREIAPKGNKRMRATVTSQSAAKRMEAYMESNGLGQTEFAGTVGTTDRTLRAFRRTGKVRRDIFNAIAKAMGTTREGLLKPE